MLVVAVSAKGSPGVSTLALGLAARWPGNRAVLMEADPAGGDAAARFGLHHEPGLAAMALAARHAGAEPDSRAWLQSLPCGISAVLAAPGGAAAASLAAMAGREMQMLRLLAGEHPAVVVDAGRWRPSSAADPLLAAADVVLLVARPELDEIRQCDVRLPGLRERNPGVRLVLVGERGGWAPEEIGAALNVQVAEVLPNDRRGAGVLTGRLVPRKGWDSVGWTRLPLLRACHGLARRLAAPQRPASGVPVPGGQAPPRSGQLKPGARRPAGASVVRR